MKELKAKEYKRFEDIKRIQSDGTEFWSARELAPALEYTKWENFHKVIKRAMLACENSGRSVKECFPEVRKTSNMSKGGTKPENLPTPEKSIQEIEKEQMVRLKAKAKAGKLMLDE